MSLRVVHQATDLELGDDEVVTLAKSVRDEAGCLQAEVYRDIEAPERVAFVQLWEDQYQYGSYWSRVLESGTEGALPWARSGSNSDRPWQTEFYTCTSFSPDRVWVPQGQSDRAAKIFWPAAGAVRVLSQSAVNRGDAASLLDNARETRHEPGCLEFRWHRSVEFEDDALLLELWRDQATYDAHWHLRLKTMPPGGPRERPRRRRGESAIEFYRHQPFVHLYDRWLPADETRWSETIIWPD